jgi:MscS family membrane protein
MNSLIDLINQNMPNKLLIELAFYSLSPGEIIVALFFLGTLFVLNYLIKAPIRKAIKLYLFKNRKNMLYRLLTERVEKILKPFRFFLNTFLLKKIFEILLIPNFLLESLFFALYIFFLLWFFYEIGKFLLYFALASKIKKQKGARRELFNIFLNIFRGVIFFIFLFLVLSYLGIDLTALLTSLGIGGAIIGLGAKDTLTNFFDSIRLVSEDIFHQGDWIETKDIEGFVTEVGLTSTKIRTFDNALVTLPNSLLVNGYVKNWTRRIVGRRIKFHIRLKYSTDTKEIDKVVYEIYEMLHSHPDIVNNNKLKYLRRFKKTYEDGLFNIDDKYGVRRTLLVYLDEIDLYSMNILVYAFSISVNWEEWLRVKQDVIKKILKIIENSSLELAIPQQEIFLEQKRGERRV